jgi:hypothetical protein
MAKVKAAIIGSGNIGTDLMIKIMRTSDVLEMGAMVGIDPSSDGLARRSGWALRPRMKGIEGLQKLDVWPEIGVVFDATSAGAHKAHSDVVTAAGKVMIDLTPAAIGPYVDSGRQRRRPSRRAQRQHGDLRRAGDDPDGRGGQSRWRKCIMPRSSPRSRPNPLAPAPAPISTSSPRRRARAS